MSMEDPGWGSEVPLDEPAASKVPAKSSGGSPPARPGLPGGLNPRTLVGAGIVILFIVAVVVVALVSHTSKSSHDTSHSSSTSTAKATSTTVPASTTTTISVSDAAKQYLAIEQPANNALLALQQTSTSWGPGTSTQQMTSDADPAINAMQQAATQLEADNWPPGMQADIKALATQVSLVASDLENITTITSANVGAWQDALNKDSSALTVDINTVRHDLGLPPAVS